MQYQSSCVRPDQQQALELSRPQARASICALCGALGLALACTGTAAAEPGLTLELNKLEPQDTSCKAYLVVDNPGSTGYQALKLDLILFQPDGVIGRRLAVDLAPMKAAKKSVKIFVLDGTACDKIGSLLINEVTECKSDSGPINDCLAAMTVKSLTTVQLSK